MARHDKVAGADTESPPGREIGEENKPAVAASREAPEPAAPDGTRTAGPRPASGEPGRDEAPLGVPEVPDHSRADIGAYRLWGLIALAIVILVLLVATF